MNFNSGIDFGKRDLVAQGDILVFGMLGGFVQGALDYKSIVRSFDFDGPEVGAYATYLNGNLFIDTLFKTQFLTLDGSAVLGFPDTLHATTYGVRSDMGYRFGGFDGGIFVEPLLTLAASWNDTEDFHLHGNTVNLGDESNVRGRVGLRAGTTTSGWAGTIMEPFIVASLWGTLSGDHSASLTSTGTTFHFSDEPDDLWGVLSAGVNFFNMDTRTVVFGKFDVVLGDETDGVAAKAGMRVSW